MNTIKVNKDELVATLISNREKHLSDYAEQEFYYFDVLRKRYALGLEQIEEGKVPENPFYNLPRPENHERDYDRMIGMLKLSVHDAGMVELNAREYDQYVMDEWDWKETFRSSGHGYRAESESLPTPRR